jgi:hypothetical protein
MVLALVLYLLWAGTLAHQLISSGVGPAAITHGLPILLAAMLYVLARASLLGSMSLSLPITLVVLFLPLFSEDLWTIAAGFEGNFRPLLVLAGITILPLALILRRRLAQRISTEFKSVAKDLRDSPTIDQEVSDYLERHARRFEKLLRLVLRLSRRIRNSERELVVDVVRRIRRGAPAQDVYRQSFSGEVPVIYAAAICRSLSGHVRRQMDLRLLGGGVGIFAIVALYVYSLSVLLIDSSRVDAWTNSTTDVYSLRLSLLGHHFALDLPLGPYGSVAVLLGIVATAVFGASALTQDEFYKAISQALLRTPIRNCLLIGIPYLQVKHCSHPRSKFNDAFEDAYEIHGFHGSESGNVRFATRETDEPGHAGLRCNKSIWYRWTAPASGRALVALESDFDTVVAVYQGPGLRDLVPVASSIGTAGKENSLQFRAEESKDYQIVVGTSDESSETNEGPPDRAPMRTELRWELHPACDSFHAAEPISGLEGAKSGSTYFATKEYGEPDHAGNTGGKSVWYRWKAPTSGLITFDAQGSSFEALLASYTGSQLDRLREVAANQRTAYIRRPFIQFSAQRDVQYLIVVDGNNGASGDFRLRWQPAPTHNAFAAAERISGPGDARTTSTVGASKEPDEPDHAGNAGGRSVWYRWTAPTSGTARFHTDGSDFDTLLAVYQGSSLEQLDLVTANDDVGPDNPASEVSFDAVEGAHYYIAVDGYNGETGKLHLRWELTAPASRPASPSADEAHP